MSRFSNWREDLNAVAMDEGRGLMVLEVMTDEKDNKKVKEKKINNAKLIKINPSFKEAIEDIGGELIEMKEINTDAEDKEDSSDKQLKNKEKRVSMMKRQILMRKMMAVKQGAGADIVASYEPNIQGAIEYFYEEGINEEGIDLLIEEIGLEEFVNFIDESVVDLNEERAARRANVKAKSYADVKADVDKKDAAKKKAKKGEYAPSYAKKETDVTVYDDKPAKKKAASPKKPAAPKKPVTKKVVKAVAKVKQTQPVKKATKQGLGDKIRGAYKAGVKRHRKATQGARVFGKGFAAGAKKAVKFAKDVKSVVSEEELKKNFDEAKVDQGRSDYGKASIRNYRRKGPGHGEPAMFDPENKRGKLIDKRREEHKERRGVKGAKVPAYKTEEAQLTETDKKGKGSGTKDACYHKVKSRYSVWPSAYASGALVKCRKKGAANWGNSSKKESYSWRDDFEYVLEGAAWTKKEGQNKEGGLNEKGRKSYERDNPGSDLKAPSKKVGNKRTASFCTRVKGMRKRQKPSNNTGDDRLSKSLRAWNC